MTKLHVVAKGEESVQGYEKVEIVNGFADLASYSNNECSFVLASDCLDEIPIQNLQNFIALLESKMRKGATLVIGGTDIRLVARAIVRGDLSVGPANELLYKSRSCVDLNNVIRLLDSLNLKITSTVFQGFKYEIEATR